MKQMKWFQAVLALAVVVLLGSDELVMAQTSQPVTGKDAVIAAPISEKTEKAAKETTPADAPGSEPALSPLEEAIQKTKNPFPGFNWGADARLRDEYFDNAIPSVDRLNSRIGAARVALRKDALGHEFNMQRWRARWWATLTPVKNVEFYVRLCWEGRSFDHPDHIGYPTNGYRGTWQQRAPLSRGWMDERDQVMFDNLYVKLTDIGGLPITVTAGRQDIGLGDNWLVFDGTPLDGSRTFFFDAIRTTTNLKDIKTTIDAIWVQTDAQGDAWLPKIHNAPDPKYLSEQDEDAFILYVTNKSLPKTSIEPYFIYKGSQQETPADRRIGFDSQLYTFGNRVAGDITDKLKYSVNVAAQFGSRDNDPVVPAFSQRKELNICAFGSNNRLTYQFKDKMQNEVYWDYEFLSGDKANRNGTSGGSYEAFDVLWGRYPRWTEGYGYTYALESRPFDIGNLHRFGPGWNAKPIPKVDVGLYYNLLFADESTSYDMLPRPRPMVSPWGGGHFRGQILVPYFKYTFCPHASTRVMPEFFFPGNFYSDYCNDTLTFLRWEINLTW